MTVAQTSGRTASGAVANLAAQGIPFVVLIVVTPILLRAMGREQYGALVLFNLVPQIAGQLDLGLVTAATRGFAQYSARRDGIGAMRLFHEAFVLLVGWGVLLGLAYLAAHAPIARALNLDAVVGDGTAIWIASAFAMPIALANSATLIPLKALERYGQAAGIQVTAGVVYWAAAATLATHGVSLTSLVLLGTATVAATTVALFVAGRDVPSETSPGTDVDERSAATLRSGLRSGLLLRPFIPQGLGAFVAQSSSLATYHADKLLVSALVSPAAAGAYAICVSVANKILLVVAAGATFTFPRSTRLQAEGDVAAIAATFDRATRLSMVVAVAIAAPLVALAPAFLAIWVGASFAQDYGTTLRLLAVGYVFAAASVVASNVAVGIGEVRIPALFALLGGALTLVAVTILAPRHGAAGAAAAAALGMTQALVFNDVIARRLGPAARGASWPLLWKLLVVATPSVVVAAALASFVTGWWTLLSLGLAAGAIVPSLWFVTFADADERTLLQRLLTRTDAAPHP